MEMERIQRLRKLLQGANADSILVSHPLNVGYLTGFFGGDSWLLVTSEVELLISDARYSEDISRECPKIARVHIRDSSVPLLEATATCIGDLSPARQRCLIEADHLTVRQFQSLQDSCRNVEFELDSAIVAGLRSVKDESEITSIRRAITMAESALRDSMPQWRPQTSEREIATQLFQSIREHGGAGFAFSPIVGVGTRAALPHGVPTDAILGEQQFVLIDWGANEGQYLSDLTRVIPLRPIGEQLKSRYEAVLEAHRAAANILAPGVGLEEVDSAARKVLRSYDLEPYFTHGLGHGFGLEIHESPRMGKKQKGQLEENMVVTIEPGVYFPEWGGIRIEDDYRITEHGAERLSTLPQELESWSMFSSL